VRRAIRVRGCGTRECSPAGRSPEGVYRRAKLRILRILLVMGLVAAVTYAVSAKRLSVLSVSQGAMSAHSDESALLKAFAEIQPIDAHMHVYRDDPTLDALM